MSRLLSVVIVLALLISVGASAFAYQGNLEKERMTGLVDRLQVELETARNHKKAAEERAAGLGVETTKLQAEREGLTNWLTIRQNQLSLAVNRIEDLETLLGKRGEEVKALEADLGTGKAETALLKTAVASGEKKLLSLEKEKRGLETKITYLLRQIESVRKEKGNPSKERDSQREEIVVLSTFLAQFAASAASQTSQKGNPYRVVPVFFASNDSRPYSKELIGKIDGAMAEVQAWFYHYTGKTFEFGPSMVIRGEHPSLWYYDPGNSDPFSIPDRGGPYARILAEIASHVPVSQDKIYAVFFHGGDLSRIARGEKNAFMNFSIFGDWVIDYLNAKDPEGWQIAVGIIAHELAHVLGLSHNLLQDSVMWWIADRNNIFGGFSKEELLILSSSPFLR